MFGKDINHGVSYTDEENRLRQGCLVEKLFESVQKNTQGGKTTFIAILGPEASGKTTFSTTLKEEFEKHYHQFLLESGMRIRCIFYCIYSYSKE